MHNAISEWIGWSLTAVGAGGAWQLAQVVINGDGLAKQAQLALVVGMVLVQLLAVILLHLRIKERNDDDS